MEAYCMKCKTRREVKDPEATFNAKGSPVTIGVCLLRHQMYRMGRTPAHGSQSPPAAEVEKRSGKLVIVGISARRPWGDSWARLYREGIIGHVRDLLRSGSLWT
jgi:DNA topoisomerase-1